MAQARAVLAASVAAWAFLAWIAVDMGHPLVQLTMPGVPDWSMLNVLAVFVMWAVMMAAMMLPSALPMILAFARLSDAWWRAGSRARLRRRRTCWCGPDSARWRPRCSGCCRPWTGWTR